MRNRRWLDLLKDYDCEICYHQGKANVLAILYVAEASSLMMIVTSDLFGRIKLVQEEALKEENWKMECILSQIPHLVDDSRDVKTHFGRVYILVRSAVKDLLLEEAHKSKYSIHPRATKMYLDLKRNYWWSMMKIDCVKYVEKCLLVYNQNRASKAV